MTNYQETRVKLRNSQWNKFKSAAEIKTGTILIINEINIKDEELSHKLFLTTRQTTKIRNTFASSISTDTKPSKAQNSIAKMIQSGRCFGSW